MKSQTGFAVQIEIENLTRKYGIGRLAFVTLTFLERVTDEKEAQKIFKSFRTNVLGSIFQEGIWVLERSGGGRLHYHAVCVVGGDIRTGFDFDAVGSGDYGSGGKLIKKIWRRLRHCRGYGIGRCEVLPVRFPGRASRYLAKYLAKCQEGCGLEKGTRIVRWVGFGKKRSAWSALVFNGPRGYLWRQKLAAVCRYYGLNWKSIPRGWIYRNMEFIKGWDLTEETGYFVYRDEKAANQDGRSGVVAVGEKGARRRRYGACWLPGCDPDWSVDDFAAEAAACVYSPGEWMLLSAGIARRAAGLRKLGGDVCARNLWDFLRGRSSKKVGFA